MGTKKEGLVNFTVTGLPSRDTLANAVGIHPKNDKAIEWLRIAAAWFSDNGSFVSDETLVSVSVLQALLEQRGRLLERRYLHNFGAGADSLPVAEFMDACNYPNMPEGYIAAVYLTNAIRRFVKAVYDIDISSEQVTAVLDDAARFNYLKNTQCRGHELYRPTKQGLTWAASILEHIHANPPRGRPPEASSVFVEDEWKLNKDVKAKYIADKWDAMTDDDRRRYHEGCFKRGTYVGKGYETFLEKNGGKEKGREIPITKVLEKLRRNEQKKGK